MRIKTGDNVRVIAGRDRGHEGKGIQAFPRDGKIVVEKVNMLKKHIRSRKQGEPGQRIELAAPISVTRVQLLCGSCGKVTRVGMAGSGADKRRVCKKCKKEI